MSIFVNSALNYTGSKYRLLGQIMPFLPKNNDIFIDLCCGGGSVGINASAKKIILNDKNTSLIGILRLFQNVNFGKLESEIESIIDEFNLSKSSQFGYKFYNADSSSGLGKINKIAFERLKFHYNSNKSAILLFVLLIFSFNNQIRFNSKGEFNLPCGKRDFNDKMRKKLRDFVNILQNKNIEILNFDFREFYKFLDDFSKEKSFFYIDPPYYLANASYNENGGWSYKDEKELLEFLDALNNKNIKFAFSNVLYHNEKEHSMLKNWQEKSNYKLHILNFSYKNCNYQRNKTSSQEVLVTNY